MQPDVLPDGVKLRLPDGTLIMENGTAVSPKKAEQRAIGFVREIQSGREAAATLQRIHRKLGDLPTDGHKMNAIAATLMYTAVGLSDEDIAKALATSPDNIKRLKQLDAFTQLAEMFDSTVFDDAKRTANHILSRAASRAAERIVDAIDDDDPNIALVASRDVTRLEGVGVDGEQSRRIGGLNIVIRRKGERGEDDISINVE